MFSRTPCEGGMASVFPAARSGISATAIPRASGLALSIRSKHHHSDSMLVLATSINTVSAFRLRDPRRRVYDSKSIFSRTHKRKKHRDDEALLMNQIPIVARQRGVPTSAPAPARASVESQRRPATCAHALRAPLRSGRPCTSTHKTLSQSSCGSRVSAVERARALPTCTDPL